MNKCLIIRPRLINKENNNTTHRMQEIRSLVETLSDVTEIYNSIIYNIRKPNPSLFIGLGTAQSIKQLIIDNNIDTVVLDTIYIQPIQQRNLTKLWQVKIIDRTQVILQIFQQHATTYTGKLQVSLASLMYQRSRLVSSWQHLEKQRGGIKYIAGPGESQLELDKRMLNKKIGRLQQQLKSIHKNNQLLMRKRTKNNLPLIALAGYTSAGKSTLFNTLTNSCNSVHIQPFTTLNTITRVWQLNHGIPCILVDTIGFIHDLSHDLIDAFRATLVGLHEADFILHVQDFNNQNLLKQRQVVISTLRNIKVHNPKIINVFNKIDLVHSKPISKRKYNIYLSAQHGTNCQKLTDLISDLVIKHFYEMITVDLAKSTDTEYTDRLNWLYKYGYVIDNKCKSSLLCFYLANHQVPEYYNRFAITEPTKYRTNHNH